MPYLARLGVTHLYCSPYLQAAPGSRHGYDVVDHSRVNQELGGEAGHARLCAALQAHGMGQVLDVVPNHMAIAGRLNGWWWDVLKHGVESRYAAYFDVAWEQHERKLRGPILVPVLADHYGRELEAGRLHLERVGDELVVRYHEHEFPVDPGSVIDAFGGPLSDERLAEVNADIERLDGLLDRQHYRLARWRVASDELDYRRFFDVNDLVALRAEEREVFDRTHELALRWLGEGVLDGLRVDHPDGLRDPQGYFERLAGAAPGGWIVAEKILQGDEELPAEWPVAGTTGYDFLNGVLRLLVDPAGREQLVETFTVFAGAADWEQVAWESKHTVMRETLAADVNRLVAMFQRVCEEDRRYRDFTRRELEDCLRESIACLRVYRTYVRPGLGRVTKADRFTIGAMTEAASRRRPDLDPELFHLLDRVLRLEEDTEAAVELVWRFQQTSGPVAAKGLEDTAFYRWFPLAALAEVGGDPDRFAVTVDEFHAASARRAERWPRSMLTTATHDDKRGEDVRARLAVLSEMPGAWREAVERWSERNERHRQRDLPDRAAEYLLYQTLVGAWPISTERATAYMEKASREAKVHTSWLSPNAGYDAALRAFVEGVLSDPGFVTGVEEFVARVADPGRVNSLAQKLLCLTAPGVPDVYQGAELWDLSLVDPDNRRPVDFGLRARLLEELDGFGAEAARVAWARRAEGLPKLLVVSRALRLRAERPEMFLDAGYEALLVSGSMARHLVAFCRGGGAVVAVPRLSLRLDGRWEDTTVDLPPGRWRDRFGGAERRGGATSVGDLFADFPVALLERLG